jgi:hypothetical protein
MHGHGSVLETGGTSGGPTFRGRPTKFTPERINQIKNLVERGKSREEIAELIGVTPASLTVTCSKLGISLRRRMVNNGVRLLSPAGRIPTSMRIHERREMPSPSDAASTLVSHEVAAGEGGTPSEQAEAPKVGSPRFAIRMEYKGVVCKTELALTLDMIEGLAIEAELRSLRIGEFIRDIVLSTVKNGLFREELGA